jgi:hypothetical protein
MDINLAIICGLTFVIHLIGTLAYAARIAGVRTGQTRDDSLANAVKTTQGDF